MYINSTQYSYLKYKNSHALSFPKPDFKFCLMKIALCTTYICSKMTLHKRNRLIMMKNDVFDTVPSAKIAK